MPLIDWLRTLKFADDRRPKPVTMPPPGDEAPPPPVPPIEPVGPVEPDQPDVTVAPDADPQQSAEAGQFADTYKSKFQQILQERAGGGKVDDLLREMAMAPLSSPAAAEGFKAAKKSLPPELLKELGRHNIFLAGDVMNPTETFNAFQSNWKGSSKTINALGFAIAAQQVFGGQTKVYVSQELSLSGITKENLERAATPESMAGVQKSVANLHGQTQQTLPKDVGKDPYAEVANGRIRLYRGIEKKYAVPGSVESWTSNPDTASLFGMGRIIQIDAPLGAVLVAHVSPQWGEDDLQESEYILVMSKVDWSSVRRYKGSGAMAWVRGNCKFAAQPLGGMRSVPLGDTTILFPATPADEQQLARLEKSGQLDANYSFGDYRTRTSGGTRPGTSGS